jgi:16S rRNA (guanine527-N7)-methyltransferase
VDAYLERWLEELLATPGVTGIEDRDTARRMLVDDALRAAPLLERWPGAVIDVGSGGGVPGIPLAARFRNRAITLLEAERRKCDFLERVTAELDNVTVIWGRAEDQRTDAFGVAVAKALAKPPVAAELCLPLVAPGGAAILWLGETADLDAVAAVAQLIGSRVEENDSGLVVLRKLRVTPPGFPRRAGVAKKRPLA